jgi:hypothetical protein
MTDSTARLREWQPIATAPKDGTPVLVCEKNGWRCVAMFQDGLWNPWVPFVKIQCEPTHWMPLTPAPETGETEPAAP